MKNLNILILIAALGVTLFTSCDKEDDPIPQPLITDNPIIDTTGLSITDTIEQRFKLGTLTPDSVLHSLGSTNDYLIQNTYTVSIKQYLANENILVGDISQIFVTDISEDPFYIIDIRTTNNDVLVDLVCSRESYGSNTHEILTTVVTDSKIYKITCEMDILPSESFYAISSLLSSLNPSITDEWGEVRSTEQIYPTESTTQSVHSYTFFHRYIFDIDNTIPRPKIPETRSLGGIPITEVDNIRIWFKPNNKLVLLVDDEPYNCSIRSSNSTSIYIEYQDNLFTLNY